VVQGGYAGTGNISTAPLLAPLGTYGGTTKTLALLPGSSAIDGGNAAYCPATDQRGIARPQGSACDMGAFESRGFTLTKTGGDNQAVWVYASFATALSLTVTANSAGEPVNGGVLSFTGPGSGAGLASTVTATITNGTASGAATANGVPGSYTVSASASGAASASYSLTNILDIVAPSVTVFTVSSPSNTLSIPVTAFTASDNNAVTGYFITTSSAQPDAGAAGWTVTAPTNYPVTSAGTYTLYPWAKDVAGNVSAVYSSPAVVTLYPVIYARPGGLTSGFCGSWADACELRYALANAVNGQEIWVQTGTYKTTTSTDRYATFQLKSGVGLYGGFNGTETARSQRNIAANLTVLSGDIGQLFSIRFVNALHVVTGADNSVLDGFTIFGGNANATPPYDRGGGMYNSNASPWISNCIFSNNGAVYGGGMYNENSNPTLTNCTFSGNTSAVGIIGNIIGYIGSSVGGGMYNDHSNPALTNCTFSGNSPTGEAGGIFNSNSTTIIRNSILWGDSAGELVGTGYTVSYSVIQGGYSGTGNISIDPLLAPFGNYGGLAQTYVLLPGSSAIDAADPADCPVSDQRGMARPQGSACDIGAFESQGFTLTKTGGDGQSAVINTTFATPLTLTVTANNASEPVNGGVVTFSAPASGASTNPASSSAIITSGAVSQSLTANGAVGSYSVAASAFGASDVIFSLTNTAPTAVLTVSISGSGTVTSNNQSFTNYACNKSGGGVCDPVSFGYGDTVTLTPVGSNSSFTSWSGDISGSANPYTNLLMDGDKAVTAIFAPLPATVQIEGDATPYYALGTTLNTPSKDATLRARDLTFGETITLTNSHNLKLRGGFPDADFTDDSQSGFSTINGWLKIQAGKLAVERVKIKSP